MLDLLRHLWDRNNEKLNNKDIERRSLSRLKEEYDQEITQKVFNNSDYKDLKELIEEKERSILETLNALEILYTSKKTLRESLVDTYQTETPFEFQKELDQATVDLNKWVGYTGPIGPSGYNQTGHSSNSQIQSNIPPSLWPNQIQKKNP
jgi:hypothetical protein